MSEKLSWEEIKKRYDGEWVELVECTWEETKSHPTCGVVRVHATTRKEFDKLSLENPVDDFAILYVGTPKRTEGEVLTNNLSWITRNDA